MINRGLPTVLLLAGMCLYPASTWAEAPQPLDCPTASENGQRLREQLKYRAAHAEFVSCSAASCPGVVRRDCIKWSSELDASMPTVVVAAVDENDHDMSEVEVSIDGEMLAAHVDGTPIAIDPGKHELRATSSGRVPASVSLVVRVGEKNRIVRVQFAPKTSVATAATTEPTVDTALPPPRAHARHSYAPPLLSVGLGALGLIAVGSFAAFGITAKSDLGVLRDTCAPRCVDADLSSVKTRMLLADISLGVGVVALGAGTVLWVLKARKPVLEPRSARAWHFGVSPLQGGGAASVSGAF